ncbi:general odorant-binding protein 19d-like isoform X2 [Eurosta solidaginis]|uniref:general odorant-binding protein 19d-like isoform X2 n=1 Tax=Eurosta solidaginis TaxID=178769 RepID=UPI00353141AE
MLFDLKMKFVNVLLIVCIAFISYIECGDIEEVKAAAVECKESTGATDEDVERMFKREPAASTEAKCLHACVMQRFGLMNADGKMDKQKALEILKMIAAGDEEQEKLGLEIVETCADIEVNEDHCEASEEYRICMHDKAAESGFKLGRI